jgi:hypothetical protein
VAISGNQSAITPARSGVLRSGAGRSGWPLSIGRKVLLYALSNIARSDATRSNYHGPAGFISIGGGQVGTGPATPGAKVVGNLQITDALNEAPNRATFRVRGLVPKVGQDVVITLGSQNSLDRLFAGQVLDVSHGYIGSPLLAVFDVHAIDWTWGLRQRVFSHRWIGQSATTIAAEIVALGAPGYTAAWVAPNLPTLTEFTVTDHDAPQALTALANRLGGYWYVDYHKAIHLWTDRDPEPVTDPTIINPVHPTLTDLVVDTDGSQVITRVYVEGGGSIAHADVTPGETLLPVVTASWYEDAGGAVKSGPQRIRYTGRSLGGGGSLVGPGAAPSAALTATVTGGAGVTAGSHDYAVSFVTASGESLTGPRTSAVVGAIAPPLTAPTAGPLQAGPGPDPGWHDYVVTFLTATGETLIGPLLTVNVPPGLDVLAAPAALAPTIGGAMEAGSFTYAVAFGTPSGQSLIGPGSNTVTLTSTTITIPNAPAPVIAGTGPNSTVGNLTPGHDYAYGVAWSTSASSSAHTAQTGLVSVVNARAEATTFDTRIPNAGAPGPVSNGPNNGQGDLTVMNAYDYAITYSIAAGETDHSKETTVVAASSQVNALASNLGGGKSSTITVTVPFSGDATVKWTHLYRRNRTTQAANVSSFRLLASFANTTGGSTNYADLIADATILPHNAPPATNLTALVKSSHVLVDVPYGPAGVQWLHLYRVDQTATPGSNPSDYRLLASIANGATSGSVRFTDTIAQSAIAGAAAGSSANTTTTTTTTSAVPLTLPTGPAGVTKRYIYRTNGAGYRLVATINNNSATSYTDTTPTGSLGGAPPTVNTSGAATVALTKIPIGSADITGRRIYRTAADLTAPYRLVTTIADNTTTSYADTLPDAGLGAEPLEAPTALANRVQLSAIQLGASAVTSRKIYRTAAGGGALKLLTTIADNATTTYLDALADAALGAGPAGSDLSGLPQPPGQVTPGSTTLIVAGAGAFRPAGGWAVIGNGQQVIRYTGTTANALTGIPSSGPGAVVATISYNSTITAAPMLLGVPASGAGAIVYPIPKGDDVNLWIQVDDLAAQAAVALLFTSAAAGVHSGIIEDVIQDRRLSAREARARGAAHLAQRRDLQIRIRYQCRDLNARSGRTVTVNLLAPPYQLSAQFTIQSVTIRDFTPSLLPIVQVEASSIRVTFEDLLRRLGTRTDPTG